LQTFCGQYKGGPSNADSELIVAKDLLKIVMCPHGQGGWAEIEAVPTFFTQGEKGINYCDFLWTSFMVGPNINYWRLRPTQTK